MITSSVYVLFICTYYNIKFTQFAKTRTYSIFVRFCQHLKENNYIMQRKVAFDSIVRVPIPHNIL